MFQNDVVNLIGQCVVQPQQPFVHSRPKIGILVATHVSAPLVFTTNYGYKSIIQQQTLCSIQGFVTIYFPPPPLPQKSHIKIDTIYFLTCFYHSLTYSSIL